MGITSNKSTSTGTTMFKFAQGQKVFCLSEEEMFNAHIIGSKSILGAPNYKIHYHGHNKAWDAFVPEDCIRPYNEENIKLAAEMKEKKKQKRLQMSQQKQLASGFSLVSSTSHSTDDTSLDQNQSKDPTEAGPAISFTKSFKKKALKRHKRAISKLSSQIENGGGGDPLLADNAYNWQFDIDEKVLSFQGQLLYLAQCINRELRDGKAFYKMHFHGWSQDWDQWVEESQVLKYTKENIKRSKELYNVQMEIKKESRKTAAACGTKVTDLNRNLCAYAVNQSVMCYYGPQLYTAKVINVQLRNGKPHYLLHYVGWNKFWDEWVAEDRVVPYNDENIALAQQIRDDQEIQAGLPESGKPVPETVAKGKAASASKAGSAKRKASTDKEVVAGNKKVKKTSNKKIATTGESTPKKTRTRKLSKQ